MSFEELLEQLRIIAEEFAGHERVFVNVGGVQYRVANVVNDDDTAVIYVNEERG